MYQRFHRYEQKSRAEISASVIEPELSFYAPGFPYVTDVIVSNSFALTCNGTCNGLNSITNKSTDVTPGFKPFSIQRMNNLAASFSEKIFFALQII